VFKISQRMCAMVLFVSGLLFLQGCESIGGEKQTMGTWIGGATGAAMGAQFGKGSGQIFTTALGAILGASIGNDIGSSMDEIDRLRAEQAMQEATRAPLGSSITWDNTQSGHYGTVVPVRDGRAANGDYCREFQQTVHIGGHIQKAYGTACRQPDGQWRIVSTR
jgi:surface antigen